MSSDLWPSGPYHPGSQVLECLRPMVQCPEIRGSYHFLRSKDQYLSSRNPITGLAVTEHASGPDKKESMAYA